jgi:hypothetical protein
MTVRDPAFEVVIDRPRGTEVAWVAVWRRGELSGVDGLDEDDPYVRPYLSGRRQLVDHPRLPEWRAALVRLREIGGERRDAAAFATAAAGIPFQRPVGEAALRFAGDDPERAAALLREADGLDLDAATWCALARRAAEAPAMDDARLAELAHLLDEDATAAALALTGAPRAGPRVALAVLPRLDDVAFDRRAAVYEAAAAKLADDPEAAPLLAERVDDLAFDDRAPAALALLAAPGAAAGGPPPRRGELARAFVSRLDEFPAGDRVAVYSAAAPQLLPSPAGARLLLVHLEDLYGDDRLEAARRCLAEPSLTDEFALGLAARLDDEFYGDDRFAVLAAIAQSARFDAPVQRACVRAARRHLHGRDKVRALELFAARDLDPEVRATIERSLRAR